MFPFLLLCVSLEKHAIVIRLRPFGSFDFAELAVPKFSLRIGSRGSWFFLKLVIGFHVLKVSPRSCFGIPIYVGRIWLLVMLLVEVLILRKIALDFRSCEILFCLKYYRILQRDLLQHSLYLFIELLNFSLEVIHLPLFFLAILLGLYVRQMALGLVIITVVNLRRNHQSSI